MNSSVSLVVWGHKISGKDMNYLQKWFVYSYEDFYVTSHISWAANCATDFLEQHTSDFEYRDFFFS